MTLRNRSAVVSAFLIAGALVLAGSAGADAQTRTSYTPVTPDANSSTAVQQLVQSFPSTVTLPEGITNQSIAFVTMSSSGAGSLSTQLPAGTPSLLVVPPTKLPANTEGYLSVTGPKANDTVVSQLDSSTTLNTSGGQLFGGHGESVQLSALQVAQFGPVTTNSDGSLALAIVFPKGSGGDYQMTVQAGSASVSSSVRVADASTTSSPSPANSNHSKSGNNSVIWIALAIIVIIALVLWLILRGRRKRTSSTTE